VSPLAQSLNPFNPTPPTTQEADPPAEPGTATGGAPGADDGADTVIDLFPDGEEWIAQIEDTTWLTELGRAVRNAPVEFFGNLLLDVVVGFLLFALLYFLIERWNEATVRSIQRRELWDEAHKNGELERTALLRRYFFTAAVVSGVALTLGLFSLRHRVPILQTLALAVRDWLLEGGLGRILSILVVGGIILLLLRLVRKAARALTPVSGQRFERQVARAATIRSVVESGARIVLITFFALFVLGQLGANVSTLLAGVGILGLAVSFGAQSLVKDVITGFFILAEDQFGVGDIVTVAGLTGMVESISLRITTLRALDGSVHVIPNGQIDRVTVASKDWSRSVVDVEVAYRTDLDRAVEVVFDEAQKMADALGWSWRIMGPPEVLGAEAFGPSGILIRVLFKTLPKEQWGVSREFRRRIKARFDKEGIEIPFPHTTLYWGEGQKPTLAPEVVGRTAEASTD